MGLQYKNAYSLFIFNGHIHYFRHRNYKLNYRPHQKQSSLSMSSESQGVSLAFMYLSPYSLKLR